MDIKIKEIYKDMVGRKLSVHSIYKEWFKQKALFVKVVGKIPYRVYPEIIRMIKRYEYRNER